MLIDSYLLDDLSSQAASSQRLRMNYDLRTTPSDGSQRMLNALEPGTYVPVHRHRNTSEVVILLRGRAVQYFYNDACEVTGSVLLEPAGCSAITVEPGRWHRIDPLESGTVIFECKDGAWAPLAPEDILEPADADK